MPVAFAASRQAPPSVRHLSTLNGTPGVELELRAATGVQDTVLALAAIDGSPDPVAIEKAAALAVALVSDRARLRAWATSSQVRVELARAACEGPGLHLVGILADRSGLAGTTEEVLWFEIEVNGVHRD